MSKPVELQTRDFDYVLPADLIAQTPLPVRDASRLLVVRRDGARPEHRLFTDLAEYFEPGDVLVLNNSKVFPARLRGRSRGTGGRFEMLLIGENQPNDWWAMLRPARRAGVGKRIELLDGSGAPTSIEAVVTELNAAGHRRLRFEGAADILDSAEVLGEVPLPPYIERLPNSAGVDDRSRYQTVYARERGSVAAPTAGLHFTTDLLDRLRAKGVVVCCVTLHVGAATFAPVKSDCIADHTMHEELYHVDEPSARLVENARQQGHRVVAVGTTTVRVLESIAAHEGGRLTPGSGRTRIFIYPPREFRVVDALVTNFHLPRSTLLMLVCAFASPGNVSGRDKVLAAYQEAIARRYRFYSYGDAMLVI